MKKKYKLPASGALTQCTSVYESCIDYGVYEDVHVGYDEDMNLIVMCEHTDYDEQDYDCAVYAILNNHEAFRLARRLKVTLPDLPSEIAKSMTEREETECPYPYEAGDCFKEITECMIYEGCRFRIRRKPARNGYFAF